MDSDPIHGFMWDVITNPRQTSTAVWFNRRWNYDTDELLRSTVLREYNYLYTCHSLGACLLYPYW